MFYYDDKENKIMVRLSIKDYDYFCKTLKQLSEQAKRRQGTEVIKNKYDTFETI